jgi:hypothetical protein
MPATTALHSAPSKNHNEQQKRTAFQITYVHKIPSMGVLVFAHHGFRTKRTVYVIFDKILTFEISDSTFAEWKSA